MSDLRTCRKCGAEYKDIEHPTVTVSGHLHLKTEMKWCLDCRQEKAEVASVQRSDMVDRMGDGRISERLARWDDMVNSNR